MLTIRWTVGFACAGTAPCFTALADELHVPSQYPTIAAAVAASQAGDEIILADGEYTGDGNHDIMMPGHALTLRSASGDPEECVIRMRDVPLFAPERAFTFTSVPSGTVLRGITIANGAGPGRGGGVFISGGAPRFEDCIFRGNRAYEEPCGGPTYGGAVYMTDSNAVFERCDFIGNFVSPDACSGHGGGGGVSIAGGAPAFIDCHFAGNQVSAEFAAAARGGGMHVASADVLLLRTRFERQIVWSEDSGSSGGAISGSGAMTAIECAFVDNSVAGGFDVHGGAVALEGGELRLINSHLTGNKASSDFSRALGGVVHASGGEVSIINCFVAGNTAEVLLAAGCDPSAQIGGFGAALCLGGSASAVVRSSTLVDNVSGDSSCGGDVACLFGMSALDIANSIVWGSGGAPFATFEPGVTVQVAISDVEGGWPGEGNINAEPMFIDPAAGDYRLSGGSPAADAGANDLVPPDTFDLDADGDTTEPLPLDLAFAARFTDDPAAPDTGRGAAPIIDMGAYETVVDGCYADCDGSGGLDFFDFLCFQDAFAAGEPYADCDGSGGFDFFDFLCFQNAFAAGCE